MSFEYIRKNYGVPAKRGGRIEYTGDNKSKLGTITAAKGAHLLIRIDGERRSGRYHPTWKLRYLPNPARQR